MSPRPWLLRFRSDDIDDDGRPKRTGNVWTASVHILTTVIGSGILSLAWSTAQLGWIAGPIALLLLFLVSYFTSTLLSACYRSGDDNTGRRNYTYMDVVRSNLGKVSNVVHSAILVPICRRHSGSEKNPCNVTFNPQMIVFGVTQFIFSQIPDADQLWCLNVVTAVSSFVYSTIGLGLSIAKIAETGKFRGSLAGFTTANVTATEKTWRSFQALGDIAFAYSFSSILIEIQDTVKSPPSEAETMKKASLISLGVTMLFYMLCGCFGYAAFGDLAPANFLHGFGSYKPYWPLDLANAALTLHLVSAYQVYCQPLFKFVEEAASQKYPDSKFITKDFRVPIPGSRSYKLNFFRLIWRTIFVVITTVIAMILPFFKEAVSLLGAWGFWPLTVYFPVEIFIARKKIPKWSSVWIWLQILSFSCLIITIAAAAGSMAGIVLNLKS
ncbi:Amino acid permease [Melia azedarach]|uniref:Amino acid permease n=1 Tax=Melia azedarach TaxID=155640 RepID=A0ACC1WP32_MELAZ|nr:Amino acid permease [Melia azedarach]